FDEKPPVGGRVVEQAGVELVQERFVGPFEIIGQIDDFDGAHLRVPSKNSSHHCSTFSNDHTRRRRFSRPSTSSSTTSCTATPCTARRSRKASLRALASNCRRRT